MQTKFTKQKLLLCDPCSDGLAFAKSLNFEFAKIYDTCDRGDWLIWLLRKSGNLDKPKAVELAIACARHVLKIFEQKYPDNKRPRKAIEAALEWLKNPTENNRESASAYAAAANAAYAYAADAAATNAAAAAAAAAADAAYAAAAYAAAYAASAASAAAAATYADAAYADAAKLKERKWQADKIREIVTNPFKSTMD